MVMKNLGGGRGFGGGGRTSGGITGKGGVNVKPEYKEVGPSVKVVKPRPENRTIKKPLWG
jgi:hypothetical protein